MTEDLQRLFAGVRDFGWDPKKRESNLRNHTVDLTDFAPGSSPTRLAGRIVFWACVFLGLVVGLSAVNGAVRLSIAFEDDGPELVGRCLSGICPPDGALPNIEWQKPSVAIDLVPVKIGDSLSLKAKHMEIMGTLEPRCLPSAGFFAGSLCRAVLPQVKRTISKLRSDLDKGLVEQVNASAIQEKIAQSLKAFLAVGPAGEVHISKIAVDSEGKAVVVSFYLAC